MFYKVVSKWVEVMGDKQVLGGFEFATVMAILRLNENAYGVTIRQSLDAMLGRTVAIGAVYTTLARLEGKGLVSSYASDPTPERGGRSKRFYRLEASGHQALSATIAEQDRMRQALPMGALTV
jgi:DNA-binding PadR family transcriptional regulator